MDASWFFNLVRKSKHPGTRARVRAQGSSVAVRPPASGSRLQRSSCSSVLPYFPYGVGKYALIVRSVNERFACNGCRILCGIYGPYFGADCGYCERQKNDCTLSKSIRASWLDSTQQLFIYCWYCCDDFKTPGGHVGLCTFFPVVVNTWYTLCRDVILIMTSLSYGCTNRGFAFWPEVIHFRAEFGRYRLFYLRM